MFDNSIRHGIIPQVGQIPRISRNTHHARSRRWRTVDLDRRPDQLVEGLQHGGVRASAQRLTKTTTRLVEGSHLDYAWGVRITPALYDG